VYLGDPDPSGLDMSRDLEARFSEFHCAPLHLHRIALTMEQVNSRPAPTELVDALQEFRTRPRQSWGYV
jgi:hypothetical protein